MYKKIYVYMYVYVFSYPMCPPVVRFLTKIFHPNISRHGDVGIDSIHYNWSLALTLSKVLISVQSLLTDPYCEVCLVSALSVHKYICIRTYFIFRFVWNPKLENYIQQIDLNLKLLHVVGPGDML